MLSDTLTEGLEQYGIGPKVRALRLGKKLGLVQLGEHTGLSSALLSKIERGQLFPTLPTLLRIALVFGVGLEHFFVEEERPAFIVSRNDDRILLPDRAGMEKPSYFFESLDYRVNDREMDTFRAEFVRTEPTDPHQHEGTEFIYVLSGSLVVSIAGKEAVLSTGDTMHFEGDTPHTYRRQGRSACSAIVVVAH